MNNIIISYCVFMYFHYIFIKLNCTFAVKSCGCLFFGLHYICNTFTQVAHTDLRKETNSNRNHPENRNNHPHFLIEP